jgi:hypothetical protein
MSAIVMIASYQSGTLNVVSALSFEDVKERLQGINKDQLLRALESLDANQAGMIEIPNQAGVIQGSESSWYVVAIFIILALCGSTDTGGVIDNICEAITVRGSLH